MFGGDNILPTKKEALKVTVEISDLVDLVVLAMFYDNLLPKMLYEMSCFMTIME